MPDTFLSTTTITSSASTVVAVSGFSLATDEVLIGELDLTTGTDNTTVNVRLATDAVPTYSQSYYHFLTSYNLTNDNGRTAASDNHISITGTTTNFNLGSAAGERLRARIEMRFLTEAKRTRSIGWHNTGNSTSGRLAHGKIEIGKQNTAEAVTHLEIFGSNAISGVVHWSKRRFVVAPVNTVAPSISGSPVEGQSITGDNGTWTGTPTPTFTYQHQRDNLGDGNFVDIAGATSSSYTLVAADVGHDFRRCVIATNSEGSATAYSTEIGPVTAAPSFTAEQHIVPGYGVMDFGADEQYILPGYGVVTKE